MKDAIMRRRIRINRIGRPRRRFHVGIWLIGLAFLALTGRWWPGILLLIIISIFLEAALSRREPAEFDEGQSQTVDEEPEVATAPRLPGEIVPTATEAHHAEWLPLSCPKCGAPTRAEEVRWTGNASAACPYCGSNLPMNKS
jgi:predicted RNA-binding Zn-ribbon protein involved in translation (DUF1610 family)